MSIKSASEFEGTATNRPDCPSGRCSEPGDLVKLDSTAEKNGFIADAAITPGVGLISERSASLLRCARRASHAVTESLREK